MAEKERDSTHERLHDPVCPALMAERWNCGEGRPVTQRAVTAASGCDDFFHDDDGTVCRHIKAPAPPERLTVVDILRDARDG